jgi:hypothetical protein
MAFAHAKFPMDHSTRGSKLSEETIECFKTSENINKYRGNGTSSCLIEIHGYRTANRIMSYVSCCI